MTCANHPDRPATAFCQSCGKALCPECTRSADGLLLCEPCLRARHPEAAAVAAHSVPVEAAGAGGPGWQSVPPVAGAWSGGSAGAGAAGTAASSGAGFAGYASVDPAVAGAGLPANPGGYRTQYAAASRPTPFLAGLLGLIPGAGAMYNGQFVKALVHVLVFVGLVGVAEHFDFAGFLIAAWVLYQVFDAAQTASARRDGRPLPDPFGLLELNLQRGGQPYSAAGYTPPVYPTPAYPPQGAPVAGFAGPGFPGAGTAQAPPATQAWAGASTAAPGVYPAQTAAAEAARPARRGEPVGAIVLIVVGLLLLLSTLGLLRLDWLYRGWPILLVLLGLWLLVSRLREAAPLRGPIAGPPPGQNSPPAAPAGYPLSISPQPGYPQPGEGASPQSADFASAEETER